MHLKLALLTHDFPTKSIISKMMEPYYGNTKNPKYLSWVDDHEFYGDEIQNFEKVKEKYPSFEDFFFDHFGFKGKIINGKFHGYANPNDKWDWYVVGGRWNNNLLHKNGTQVNTCAISNLDFEKREEEIRHVLATAYDTVINHFGGSIPEYKTIDSFKNKNRDDYFEQYAIKEFTNLCKRPELKKYSGWPQITEFDRPREEFINDFIMPFSTYAILGQNNDIGEWYEKDYNNDNKEEQQKLEDKFKEMLKQYKYITIIDYHT